MDKNSVILMGVDWSRAAKLKAMKDIRIEHPRTASFIESLDKLYKK